MKTKEMSIDDKRDYIFQNCMTFENLCKGCPIKNKKHCHVMASDEEVVENFEIMRKYIMDKISSDNDTSVYVHYADFKPVLESDGDDVTKEFICTNCLNLVTTQFFSDHYYHPYCYECGSRNTRYFAEHSEKR